jgi:hypothetical protein
VWRLRDFQWSSWADLFRGWDFHSWGLLGLMETKRWFCNFCLCSMKCDLCLNWLLFSKVKCLPIRGLTASFSISTLVACSLFPFQRRLASRSASIVRQLLNYLYLFSKRISSWKYLSVKYHPRYSLHPLNIVDSPHPLHVPTQIGAAENRTNNGAVSKHMDFSLWLRP